MTSPYPQVTSGFYPILESLITEAPSAVGAAFCDAEGESIELCGSLDPDMIRLAGAHAAIVLHQLMAGRGDAPPLQRLTVSCQQLTLVIRPIQNYCLALLIEKRTFSAGLDAAIEKACAGFIREAGL